MRIITLLLVSWAANALVLAIVTWAFDDVRADTTGSLLLAAALFGVFNTILKPILRLLTLPFAVVTLGLAWFGVSMVMLALTAWVVDGFDIDGFWTLVWATVAVWVVNVVLDVATGTWRDQRGV